jgi:hypothetical protein
MKLVNETPHAARLLKNLSPRGDHRMIGCVIARALLAVKPDGACEPVPDERWSISPSPSDTPFGRAPGDKPFYSGGIDVLLGGKVTQPGGEHRERLDVELSIGRTFRRRIAIFGDRIWARALDGSLVASPPRPFRTMPLSYDRAFGGSSKTPQGLPAPYAENPSGKGYYLDAAEAEGQPLPNIENPAMLVSRWDDRPLPVGLGYYAETGPLRGLSSIDHPEITAARGRMFGRGAPPAPPASPAPSRESMALEPDQLRPTLFNQAHPDMVIEASKGPKPGDVLRLTGGRRTGDDLVITLPETAFHLYVQLQDRQHVIPLHLDQIGLLAGEDRLLLSFRTVLEYRTAPGERRVAVLHEGPVPRDIPDGYRRDLRDEWDLGKDDWKWREAEGA